MREDSAGTCDDATAVAASGLRAGRSTKRKKTMPTQSTQPAPEEALYAKIDVNELRQFPNEVLAIFRDGGGFLRDPEGAPLHAASRRELQKIVAEFHPTAVWRHMLGPVDLSCCM